jgi:hypothetical protein
MKAKFTAIVMTALVAVIVTGCGGGGGSSSTSGGGSGGGTVTPYTPAAAVVAAKQTNYATPFYAANPLGTGCAQPTTTVYVQANTITYAAAGVSDASQQQAAEYSEQAVQEIRTAIGLSATTGFSGSRVQICVQKTALAAGADGIGESGGFVALSTDSTLINNGYLINGFDLYKRLTKHELVHTFQQDALNNTTNNIMMVETWFTEGLAEYIASGAQSKTKTEILNLVNAQNPIAVKITSGTTNLVNYPAFQSSLGYLFGASGAKNNLSLLPAFFTQVKTSFNTPAPVCVVLPCPAASSQSAFESTFEATFKEADGTAMKLRTGTNNLQGSITTRLTNFLQ